MLLQLTILLVPIQRAATHGMWHEQGRSKRPSAQHPAADHGYFFWLGLLMATMHQPNPRTVMRDVKPSAKAVGEPTALLDGAARRA
jgi:hypothetical protein